MIQRVILDTSLIIFIKVKARLSYAALLITVFVILGLVVLGHLHSGTLSPSSDLTILKDRLVSLGYITTADIDEANIGKKHVTGYDSGETYDNINLYCSVDAEDILFLDMYGNLIHSISAKGHGGCDFVEAIDDDNFILFTRNATLLILDWDSNIKFLRAGTFHHDFDVSDSGELYLLTASFVNITEINPDGLTAVEYLVVLNSEGEITKKLDFSELILENRQLRELLKNREFKEYTDIENAFDATHTNAVEIIKNDVIADGKRMFKKGDVLFCMRNLDIIGVIDLEKEEIVWHWGEGFLEGPHHSSMLENGNILLFDNGKRRMYSRIIEYNPVDDEIEWEYVGNPPESFYTEFMGSVQRLPNGNTLVTETIKGHVFEVAADGNIVWEFWNPYITEDGKKRGTIYRMTRLTSDFRNLSQYVQSSSDDITKYCGGIREKQWGESCDANMRLKSERMSEFEGKENNEETDECFSTLAIDSDNSILCDKVQDLTVADDCFLTIGINLKNSRLCDKIRDSIKADECYRTISIYLKNPILCDKIQDLTVADDCYVELAPLLKHPVYCDRIQNNELVDDCYGKVGFLTENISLCEKIADRTERTRCVGRVGISSKNSSICDMVTDNWMLDECYKDVGISSMNSSICGKIQDQTERDRCYRAIANEQKV
ncbi:MAG: hypothetical protein GF414_00755 [Candidatus Altiarchaeales archaeon]|nr:hypothetical protein [Candidatus Altiarchaeales archaeon]